MKNRKNIEAARQSLDEILKRIAPYIPKPPKEEKKPSKTWQIVDSHVLPPLNFRGCGGVIRKKKIFE